MTKKKKPKPSPRNAPVLDESRREFITWLVSNAKALVEIVRVIVEVLSKGS